MSSRRKVKIVVKVRMDEDDARTFWITLIVNCEIRDCVDATQHIVTHFQESYQKGIKGEYLKDKEEPLYITDER